MGLRRVANQKHFAGTDAQLWWDFQPGQRVMTREGFAGVVTAVEDGPYAGNENYRVTLDHGMGGGDYSSSELSAVGGSQAASQAATQGAVTDDGAHTADADYPELSQILYDRPPLQHEQILGSKVGSTEPPPFDLSAFLTKDAGIRDFFDQHPYAEDAGLIGGGAWLMNQRRNDPHFQQTKNRDIFDGMRVDWCRFRKNGNCMYPKHLDVEETEKAGPGYTVWKAENRGVCHRVSVEEQKDCPLSGPGPGSGDPNARPAATEEGHYYWNKTGSSLLAPGDGLGFHLTAAWHDVQAKAREIRKAGHVRVLSVLPGEITAQVQGLENVYQTRLVKVPGRKQTAVWECGCAWAAYSWGRTGKWKRYEGRMCSHALALTYEAQSRGMFGKEIHEDKNAPHWLDPTIPVKLDGDWDKAKGRYSSLDTVGDCTNCGATWKECSNTEYPYHACCKKCEDSNYETHPNLTDTDTFAMGRGGSLPADIPPVIVMAADMVDQGMDPADIIKGLEASFGADRSRLVVKAALTIEAYQGLIHGQEQNFSIEDGKVLVNGHEINAGDVLFPEYDPSLGLHVSSLVESSWLDDKLVNYKPDRKLDDPVVTRTITDVLPNARETLYSQMPFLDDMHAQMGADPNGDVDDYMHARNSFFESLPVADVPLDNLVVTQHAINTDRVKQMQDFPETRGNSAPFFVRHDGETYAINGHHRVVQEALDGSDTTKGHLWDLDATSHLGLVLEHLPEADGPHRYDDETVLEGAEPEGALPFVEESVNEPISTENEPFEARIARLQAGMGWIKKDSGNSGGNSGNYSDSDIASAAKAALAKTGAKTFSPSEKASLIGEGVGVQASNLDRLNIKGTHYEALDDLQHNEDDEILF